MDKTFCIEQPYHCRLNPEHHDDVNYKDEYQREVYEFASKFMSQHNFKTVADVGCGSAFKFIKYLKQYITTGYETEPCFSFLKKTYPNREWLLSGEPEKSFPNKNIILDQEPSYDLVICSDVIEHIIDPDELIHFLLSLTTKYYLISTPCRKILLTHPQYSYYQNPKGPPANNAHVREWTMNELKKYLSQYFNIESSAYCEQQVECQYHLLTKL